MTSDQAADVLSRGPGEGPTPSRLPPSADCLRMPPLVAGHVHALELLEQHEALRRTRALYVEQLGHDVYFRPTGQGLTVLSLDPEAPGLIGVGSLTALVPSRSLLEQQLLDYRRKLRVMRRASLEERLSVRWLAHALRGGLALPGTRLHLVCQEWRFPLEGARSAKLDLLAVDLAERRLVVVEFKSSSGSAGVDGTPEQQAARYASWLHEGRQFFTPFFQRLVRSMAVAYSGPGDLQHVELRDVAPPRTCVVIADQERA